MGVVASIGKKLLQTKFFAGLKHRDYWNHVGDVNLGIHDLPEFPPMVALEELKDVVVYVTRCSYRAEISSVRALHRETDDGCSP